MNHTGNFYALNNFCNISFFILDPVGFIINRFILGSKVYVIITLAGITEIDRHVAIFNSKFAFSLICRKNLEHRAAAKCDSYSIFTIFRSAAGCCFSFSAECRQAHSKHHTDGKQERTKTS